MDVSSVLNAMQEQDEDLVQIIRELQEAKGRGELFDPQRLAEKIEILGPSIELSDLRSNIFAEIVKEIGTGWDEWFGRLVRYKEREGHCLVPQSFMDGTFWLGMWVAKQRQYKEKLSASRRERLDSIGFVWKAGNTPFSEKIHGKRTLRFCRFSKRAKGIAKFITTILRGHSILVAGSVGSEKIEPLFRQKESGSLILSGLSGTNISKDGKTVLLH